jgi:hypothetical protein
MTSLPRSSEVQIDHLGDRLERVYVCIDFKALAASGDRVAEREHNLPSGLAHGDHGAYFGSEATQQSFG